MIMRESFLKGLGFGVTSGVVTTVGLLMGLAASTQAIIPVVSGILIIAVADSLSDSFGIYVEEESTNGNSLAQIKEAAYATFVAKFFVAISFISFFIFFPLKLAVFISVIWGLTLSGIFSLYLAGIKGKKRIPFALTHVALTLFVILLSHYIGTFINVFFTIYG